MCCAAVNETHDPENHQAHDADLDAQMEGHEFSGSEHKGDNTEGEHTEETAARRMLRSSPDSSERVPVADDKLQGDEAVMVISFPVRRTLNRGRRSAAGSRSSSDTEKQQEIEDSAELPALAGVATA